MEKLSGRERERSRAVTVKSLRDNAAAAAAAAGQSSGGEKKTLLTTPASAEKSFIKAKSGVVHKQ